MTMINPAASHALATTNSASAVERPAQKPADPNATTAPASVDQVTLSERALLLSRLMRAAELSAKIAPEGTSLGDEDLARLLSMKSTVAGATGVDELPVGEYEVRAYINATDLENAQLDEANMMLTSGISKPSADLKYAYEAAMADLSPTLRAKDWGFSVQNGAVVIIEGSDKLSQYERKTLEQTFAAHAIGYFGEQLASLVVRAIELERGWGSDGQSRDFGQYDVTLGNFSDIVDLREYLRSHDAGGKYEWRTQLAVNPGDYSKTYFFTGRLAMMEQISAHAEARFAGDNIPYLVPLENAASR